MYFDIVQKQITIFTLHIRVVQCSDKRRLWRYYSLQLTPISENTTALREVSPSTGDPATEVKGQRAVHKSSLNECWVIAVNKFSIASLKRNASRNLGSKLFVLLWFNLITRSSVTRPPDKGLGAIYRQPFSAISWQSDYSDSSDSSAGVTDHVCAVNNNRPSCLNCSGSKYTDIPMWSLLSQNTRRIMYISERLVVVCVRLICMYHISLRKHSPLGIYLHARIGCCSCKTEFRVAL